ncbi:MAG: alpha/beta hydrolase [Sedimentisphaerales bacterium]|nr:alpha/beta hydrolase [Sedimentisphaerales bacterium]
MIDNDYFDSARDYLEFYDLTDANVSYELVPFESGQFKLAGHIFNPGDYKATVILIHGFMGHTGLMSKLIRYLIEAGYAVAAFDLPGHGLSSGERTAIDDFSQYSDSLSDFVDVVKERLDGPYHLIGFSTGASTIMEYLSSGKKDCFDKMIFAVPLVRSTHWFKAKISYQMYKLFFDDVARPYRKISSDKDFIRFVQYEDPMSARKVSLKWVKALFKWNRKMADVPTVNREILIVQGKKDKTVAWEYNVEFIQSKFNNAQIKFIPKARHEIFNESEKIRQEVFLTIGNYLENKGSSD